MAEESQSSPGSLEQEDIDLLQQIKDLERERDNLREELDRERASIEGPAGRAAGTSADSPASAQGDRQFEAPTANSEEQESGTSAAAKAAVEQTAEQRRRQRAAESKWWEFWKRWERQEPWGKGQSR